MKMKTAAIWIGVLAIVTAVHAGTKPVPGPRLVWAESDDSIRVGVRGSDGEMLVGVDLFGEPAVAFTSHGGWQVPLHVIAQLRDALDDHGASEASRIAGWVRDRMGPYADTPSVLVPVHHFATILFGTGSYIEWCGDYRQNGWCKGDCRSSCGIGRGKCCDCACYQFEWSIKLP